jgi:hypothetical protein
MSDGDGRPRPLQRLADYHVTLFCPADLPEEQLELLCAVLDEIDFRSKIETWLGWYTRARRALRPVKVTVEE